jgi:monofunctional biosynthetic peptidoglycan transglycosylase
VIAVLASLVAPVFAIGSSDMTADPTPILDFNDSRTEPDWVVVNDDVMGGVSQGTVAMSDGKLRFDGELSLANNGGFASVRTRDWTVDLSRAKALWLRVKGDGRTWQLRLATDARFRSSWVSYSQSFDTDADRWIEVRLPLADFIPTYRGRQLSGPPLDASRIRELGLLLGDGREMPFAIEVEWVRAE